MVFIADEGSKFKGPIDKVWKLNNSQHDHPHLSLKNLSGQPAGENAMILSYEHKVAGKSEKSSVKLTMYPPLGSSMEYLTGPFAGSKAFNYYITQGRSTGVNVVGEWKSPSLSDAQLKKEVLAYLEKVFNEDQENLARLK